MGKRVNPFARTVNNSSKKGWSRLTKDIGLKISTVDIEVDVHITFFKKKYLVTPSMCGEDLDYVHQGLKRDINILQNN